MTSVLERFRAGRVLFDGAMGTMLIARGLRPGRPPEEWNGEHPDIVRDVHLSYLKAGAEVVTANTFGATPSRLSSYGFGDRIDELNRLGVALAGQALFEFDKQTADGHACDPASSHGAVSRLRYARFVALSVGPTGMMLPPVGKADEGGIREEFARQLSGIDSGYDLVVIETMYDLREALIALREAKNSTAVPVAATLTYNKNPRGFFTIMGDEATRATRTVAEAGADMVGANCTITSAEMIELGRLLRGSTDLPVLCQPNAGDPRIKDGLPAYDQTPEDFARDALELFALGVNAVGGCCGTTPAFIHEVSVGLCKP